MSTHTSMTAWRLLVGHGSGWACHFLARLKCRDGGRYVQGRIKAGLNRFRQAGHLQSLHGAHRALAETGRHTSRAILCLT